MLSGSGVSLAAQPFFAVLLRFRFPERPMVVVTDQLRTQEIFQQDITTWMQGIAEGPANAGPPLFFPSWEILPHEDRLPHVDVIGDRLETLLALTRGEPGKVAPASFVVASVTALLQRTFPRPAFSAQTRVSVCPIPSMSQFRAGP